MPYVPPAPPGFVAFANCHKVITAQWKAWQCAHVRVDLAAEIERRLLEHSWRAIACCTKDGKLYWTRAEAWRVPVTLDPYGRAPRKVSAVAAALGGKELFFSLAGRWIHGHAYLELRQLAECYGAECPPESAEAAMLADVIDPWRSALDPVEAVQVVEQAPAPAPAVGRKRPGPDPAGPIMRAALLGMIHAGKSFATPQLAYGAVMHALGRSENERGYSLQTFRESCRDLCPQGEVAKLRSS